MKSTELKQKLDKALENVAKRKATIERQQKQYQKKCDIAKKLGCDPENDDLDMYANSDTHEQYWAMADVVDKRMELKDSGKKLEELKRIAGNWEEKYKKALQQEELYETKMPVVFQRCKEELAQDWAATDIRRRDEMRRMRKVLSYEEFRKSYRYSVEESLDKTDEELHRIAERDAETFIIDLYNRVKAITGEVTDWSNIHYGGKALNGTVYGVDGAANVETILAGGYNIQRLHMRVLVKEVKS